MSERRRSDRLAGRDLKWDDKTVDSIKDYAANQRGSEKIEEENA